MTSLPSLEAESLALLRDLCGPHGILASRAATANYRAVFARDAVMAGVAGLLLRDPVVTAGLVRTLEHLRQLQGAEGQVPSNYEMRDAGAHVSFGTLAPRLDAATWYLMGIALAARAGAINAAAWRESAERAVHCLQAIEYNGRHLMYVPTGGNWADEYIFEGYILYDQVLRAWALRLLAATYDVPAWRAKAGHIADTISERFFASEKAGAQQPIAAFTPVRRFEMFDLAACALLAASGIAPQRAQQALAWIDEAFLAQGKLPPAFDPVIEEGDAEWPALRRYHLHGFRNRPYEYHNGGIWPIWLGWLALGQVQGGHHDALARLRQTAHRALGSANGFAFEEYLHGRTGVALGTPHMAYTATGILFLHLAGSSAQRELLGT
ncbi:MAG: hypothetical protein IT359_12940 [Gemmatimonadaceae bacterium]|nr:hypothetical protein [Gemmatimonadaceae bacterium]